MENSEKIYKTGVALSGGGIKGLCHVGALKALEEYGIKPDIISGVSAGSVIGALYADGYSPDEIVTFFDSISFRKMTKAKRRSTGGFFSIEEFKNFLEAKLRAKTFEELQIPLRIVATDLDNGQSVVFSSGELLDPIIASCSVPILFLPQNINGINYVDGGVLKNFPVSTIARECETVIGINASPMSTSEYKVTVANVAMRVFHFMYKANIIPDKELCNILIEPSAMVNYDTFDVEKYLEIYDLGYQTAQKVIHEISGEKIII